MAEEQLRNLIDGIRARMHEELDAQLASMAESHTRAADEARRIAEAEAEGRWMAQMETARAEWNARLESDVAEVRAEASRTLAAETMRARAEAEEAAQAAAAARRELEEAFAAERQRLEGEVQAERTRVSELERDALRTAADLDSQRQRMTALAEERQRSASEVEAQLQRIADLEADRQRLAAELEAQKTRLGELEAERARLTELEADRQRLAAELATQMAHVTDVEGERARLTALEADRQRLTAELEIQKLRLIELEGERVRMTELEADRQRASAEFASQREQFEAELHSERQRAAQALAEVRAAFERTPVEPAPAGDSSGLIEAIRALDDATTLSDVLSAAVRGAADQAPHAAVFVLQGTELREWPVAGVTPVASGPLRSDGRDAGVIAEAMRRSLPATTSSFGSTAPSFASLPQDGLALAVPLVLGGAPVAVLYADGPGDGTARGSWQDNVQILGRHAAACAASITAVRTAQAMRLMSDEGASPHSTASAAAEDEIHAARRYARLLVSEIKLYNESAVRMGRERKDLLLRLEPEIERARRLYAERVAPSVHGRDALFDQELSQTLADGDHSLLGGPEQQQVSW